MEDDSQEENQRRFRSPCFNKKETFALIQLIEKYKVAILNKSVTAVACNAKDLAWAKVTKEFNKLGFANHRQVESLRCKWENLKREYRKFSKDILDGKLCDDPMMLKIVQLVCESDKMGAIDGPMDMTNNDSDCTGSETEDPKDLINFEKMFGSNGEKRSDFESEDDNNLSYRKKRLRSVNFSPQDCQVLLQCLQKEKKHVFSKEVGQKAIDLKNAAWNRITKSYNKLSPHKRSTKCLKKKFENIKSLANKLGDEYFQGIQVKKPEKYKYDNFSKIKKESTPERKPIPDLENEVLDDSEYNNHNSPMENYIEFTADPLSSVLNGDSGMGSSYMGMNYMENKEIIKLKTELLNYQLETAKLERQKLETAMKEEASDRECRSIERALRLRTARLEAIAAEARLPATHPALRFTPEESQAQQYLAQYHLEIN